MYLVDVDDGITGQHEWWAFTDGLWYEWAAGETGGPPPATLTEATGEPFPHQHLRSRRARVDYLAAGCIGAGVYVGASRPEADDKIGARPVLAILEHRVSADEAGSGPSPAEVARMLPWWRLAFGAGDLRYWLKVVAWLAAVYAFFFCVSHFASKDPLGSSALIAAVAAGLYFVVYIVVIPISSAISVRRSLGDDRQVPGAMASAAAIYEPSKLRSHHGVLACYPDRVEFAFRGGARRALVIERSAMMGAAVEPIGARQRWTVTTVDGTVHRFVFPGMIPPGLDRALASSA